MKKLSKAILIALGSVLALAVAGLFAINLYLQSPGVQARIQEELSRVLRVPLTITNTSFTPWSDLRITGISIPHEGATLLEASSFNARYRRGPLLHGRLIIYQMTVDSPKIVWAQNEKGKWELPKREKAAAISAAAAEKPAVKEVVPPVLATPEPKVAKNAPPEEPKKAKSGLEVLIEGCQIRKGSIELLDRKQRHVATLSDVDIDLTTLTASLVEGTATIGRADWAIQRDDWKTPFLIVLEELRTRFTYVSGEIDLSELTGKLGGGELAGSLHLNPTVEESPFRLEMNFDRVDLDRVLTDAGQPGGQLVGALSGTLNLAGSSKELERAQGAAKLTLRNGHFRQFAYFEMIGQALQIPELSDLRLKESHANLRIDDEKARLDSVSIEAADLQLGGTGTVRFDGKIQIAARLTASNGLVKQLPTIVRDNFVPGEGDARFIDFNITSKDGKPRTDLLNKIVGQKIEAQFDDLLSSLFSNKKSSDEKKAEEDRKKEEQKAEKKKKKMKDAAAKAGVLGTPAPAPVAAPPATAAAGAAPTTPAPPGAPAEQ